MTKRAKSAKELAQENDSLRARLEEASDVLTAIRTGGVDALVVEGMRGEQIYTLEGADHPYRTFVETMNEGAVTLAMDGTIVYCNRRFADLLGTPLEQTFGRLFLDFVPPADQPEYYALLAHKDDASIRAELSLEQTYGSTIPVRISARHLPQNCGNYWCLVVTDLRGQKLHDALRESEERLQTLTGDLEQRIEERTRDLIESQKHLRALADELNRTEQRERKRMATELHDYQAQLLALAIMNLSQVKQKQEPLSDKTTNLVHETQELVTEALNYTRTLVTDLSPPILQDCGLSIALRWLAEQMQRHQLTVTIEIPQEDDLKLPEEQSLLLFQSVRELLINASRHSGVGEATVSMAQRDGILRIEVRDRGKGFDVHAKAGGSNAVNFGLFSIRERMQALGGSIELESVVGKGTRVTLVLPLSGATAANFNSQVLSSTLSGATISHQPSASRVQTSILTDQNSRQQPVRVLLVDDHAMVRQGLRSLLSNYTDIEVVGEASNGEEALTGVVMHQPDIVVMDINMPQMNGIEATAKIRNRHPEIIVIGLSVQAGVEVQQAMLKAGAAALLNKEAAVDQLYQTIQAVQKALRLTV